MKTKFDYVAPEMEQFPLVTESGILIASDQYGDEGKAGKETPLNKIDSDF